jgi:glycosyltransferase involved in cell wall biosynthesis
MAPLLPADLLVSVVIPARDEEHWVANAVASVAAQTWPRGRLEVIVVDNGSTDATRARVQAFAARVPDLALQVVSEPVAGVARAKNTGARAAKGDLLVFLDADSRMAPHLAARVVRRARAGCPAGSIRITADSSDLLDRAFFGLIALGPRLFGVRAQMFYCARDLFERLGGFDEAVVLAEDREFLARLSGAGIPVCYVMESWIATSPRRLRRLPWRLGMVTMLVRWALANWGIGRHWPY